MFPAVDKSESFPERELAIGAFWKQRGIYEKTLAARADAPPFVFYEGPPTANGMPHPGHCLTRAIKDLFPRYRTMRGYRCERKAGWDTHGLPVEVEVCKQLGIHSKEEIESYGIEPFIQLCQKSVWRYMQEWERLTERIGFWVNLEEAYVTYHQSYVESVWWSLKTLFDRGLLYQGHKIVWWWAQGGTALSAGEVGQGYREVADPSVFVKFPLLDDNGKETDTSLLVWTTTPWTLISNQFVAVHPEIEYEVIEDLTEPGKYLVVASQLSDIIRRKWSQGKANIKAGGSITAGGSIAATGEIEAGKSIDAGFDIKAGGAVRAGSGMEAGTKVLGKELVGKRYQPPFDCFKLSDAEWQANIDAGIEDRSQTFAWRVEQAEFVSTDAGTGIVHIAPAYGEDDYDILAKIQNRVEGAGGFELSPVLLNAVAPDGKFTDEGPKYCRDRWVKDCDKDIIRDLKERGLLYHREQYVHDYPFCWRAEEDPLIQYPRESWFIKTTAFKDAMLANNSAINWLPEHIKEGRFGKFLETNVDWALSRERYWGTPLPIWVCEETGKMEAVGSYEELLAKPQAAGVDVWEAAKAADPELPDDLRVHKPYIDAITYESPFAKGARMQRVSEVIDCWYDSGAMPFAQWGYRGEDASDARKQFESQFPADFISEALDQTRGWFYSQVAISTLLFGKGEGGRGKGEGVEDPPSAFPLPPFPHPFRNCIVLGLMLGEDGQKMSKSKRNYRDPGEILDLYGADALRWFFFAKQPPWTTIRYSEQAIKDSIPEFLLRLWNVYSFFTIYANIDEFDPAVEVGGRRSEVREFDAAALSVAKSYRPVAERGELDRWVVSELHRATATVVTQMDEYDNFTACQAIIEFVDALSNWYVRRSRDRFWAKDKQSVDKLDAYWTLYECLITTTKLIAPFVPFLAESLWQSLAVAPFQERDGGVDVPESVHLCGYPEADAGATDETLSQRMNLVREIASLGRQARSSAELKVRQPLAKVEVILSDTTHQDWLEQHADVITEELNVKQLEFCHDAALYVAHEIVPNFKLLGPKLGKLMPKVKKWLGAQGDDRLLADIRDNGKIDLTIDDHAIELTREEVEVRMHPREGWTLAHDRGVVVVLATELTDELIAEGSINDLVRVIQDQRKEIGCEFTDRIEIGMVTESVELREAVEAFKTHMMQETLANSIRFGPLAGVTTATTKIGGADVELYVQVAS